MPNEEVMEIDDIPFTAKDVIMIAKAAINDCARFDAMPVKNQLLISLIAAKDYANGLSGAEWIKNFDYDEISNPDERILLTAILCVYCELRYRAVREYSASSAKSYLKWYSTILERSLSTFRRVEKKTFLEALAI